MELEDFSKKELQKMEITELVSKYNEHINDEQYISFDDAMNLALAQADKNQRKGSSSREVLRELHTITLAAKKYTHGWVHANAINFPFRNVEVLGDEQLRKDIIDELF